MKTIVIVDDDDSARNLMTSTLRKEGHIVSTADGGDKALILLRKQVDLLILDIVLPGTDGVTLLESIRANMKTKELPVIICTSSGDKDKIRQTLACGVSDFIKKPFVPDDLVEKVKNVFNEVPGDKNNPHPAAPGTSPKTLEVKPSKNPETSGWDALDNIDAASEAVSSDITESTEASKTEPKNADSSEWDAMDGIEHPGTEPSDKDNAPGSTNPDTDHSIESEDISAPEYQTVEQPYDDPDSEANDTIDDILSQYTDLLSDENTPEVAAEVTEETIEDAVSEENNQLTSINVTEQPLAQKTDIPEVQTGSIQEPNATEETQSISKTNKPSEPATLNENKAEALEAVSEQVVKVEPDYDTQPDEEDNLESRDFLLKMINRMKEELVTVGKGLEQGELEGFGKLISKLSLYAEKTRNYDLEDMAESFNATLEDIKDQRRQSLLAIRTKIHQLSQFSS